jgi:hypothetical protein
MERLAGIGVSKSTLHRWVDKYGGKLAEQRQKQGKELPESGLKGDIVEHIAVVRHKLGQIPCLSM